MTNTLAAPSDLTSYPGAPFTDALVDAAVATLRRIAGWHIAPSITETVTVDGPATKLLVLPTLWLTSVTAVRDVSGATPIALSNWRAARAGMLRRVGGWPRGFLTVTADIVHGYATTPPELFPVVAGLCNLIMLDPDVAQESLGSWSVTARETLGTTQAETLGGYTLPRFK